MFDLTAEEADEAASIIAGDVAQNAHHYTVKVVANRIRIARKLRNYAADRRSE